MPVAMQEVQARINYTHGVLPTTEMFIHSLDLIDALSLQLISGVNAWRHTACTKLILATCPAYIS